MTKNTDPFHSSYRIRSRMLCHDVRLNLWIETRVSLDHLPDPAEAEHLLVPEAERALARNLGEGCPYDLFDTQITPLD